jgi:uncharacterized membrane protein YeaQ/YmgE (transglycosylase-associated protein family)
MGLVVMIAIWVVIGLLIAALAPNIFKGDRPYGDTMDYIVSIVAMVITGLIDWYVLPLLNIEGALRFVVALIEPPVVALLVLWLMRYLKRRQAA